MNSYTEANSTPLLKKIRTNKQIFQIINSVNIVRAKRITKTKGKYNQMLDQVWKEKKYHKKQTGGKEIEKKNSKRNYKRNSKEL